MKRTLFFLIEKLEIKRGERITVTILLSMLLLSVGFYTLKEAKTNYNPHDYAELERLFYERSRTIEQERELILARYRPALQEDELASTEMVAAIPESIPPDTNKTEAETPGGLININTASAEQLTELPGIGPAYALRIVEWRNENGNFTSKEQLLEIRGIGQRRLEAIIPLISL